MYISWEHLRDTASFSLLFSLSFSPPHLSGWISLMLITNSTSSREPLCSLSSSFHGSLLSGSGPAACHGGPADVPHLCLCLLSWNAVLWIVVHAYYSLHESSVTSIECAVALLRWFCTHDIYCFCPSWERDPPLLLSLRFLPLFFPLWKGCFTNFFRGSFS